MIDLTESVTSSRFSHLVYLKLASKLWYQKIICHFLNTLPDVYLLIIWSVIKIKWDLFWYTKHMNQFLEDKKKNQFL